MLMGKLSLIGPGTFMLSGVSYYIINQGASGLSLPFNTLVWSVMALMVLFIALKVAAKKYIFTTTVLPLFIIGIAVLALVQLFAPELAWVPMKGNRVYGIFQQPNVLASFIATGLALMLFLLPGFALARARYEHCRQAFLGMLLQVLPALLVWIPSRVGWLGGALFPVRCKQAAALLGMGVMVFGGLRLVGRAERAGLMGMREVQAMPLLSRWVHQERKAFDEQVNALMTDNRTHDESLLEGYARWEQDYLTRRIDVNVYASLIMILQHQGRWGWRNSIAAMPACCSRWMRVFSKR
jgi:hypothetical protein